MRLDRLDLIAFGPFTNVVLDLSAGSEGLHLIYGLNEAGKSSALRAIQQFFRGFPHHSADDFLHQSKNLRIGAVLRDRSGSTQEFVRRKKTKNDLLGPGGAALDDAEARLARSLGGVPADEFLRNFVIDHAELVAGGREMIEGSGDLGQLLFATAMGRAGPGASRVQKALDDDAKKLFKATGSIPEINKRLDELKKALADVSKNSRHSEDWRAQEESLRAHRNREQSLKRDLHESERQRNELKRHQDALRLIAARRVVLSELRSVADAPLLAPDFAEIRREAEVQRESFRKQEAHADLESVKISTELSTLSVPEPLLDQAQLIEGLVQRLSSFQRDAEELQRLIAERAQLEREARSILRELGRDPGLFGDEALQSLRPRLSIRANVHERSADREAIWQKLQGAEKALKSDDKKRAEKAARLAAHGTVREPSALRAAVENVQQHGNLDATLQMRRDDLEREETEALGRLSSLSALWTGTLLEAVALVPPAEETIDRFQAEFDHAKRDDDGLRGQANDLDDRVRENETRLRKLHRAGDVPSEEALAAARARRDASWQRLKLARAWDDALAADVEAALRDADDLADRLYHEVERVQQSLQLRDERDRLAREREDVRVRREQARERRDEIQARWFRLWAPLGIGEPASPSEMRAWARRQAELAKLAVSVAERRRSCRQCEDQLQLHRRALGGALLALGEAPERTDETLAALVKRAQTVIKTVDQEALERRKLVEALDTGDRERPALEDACAVARADWQHWQVLWADITARIGLHADALPAETNAVLDRTATLFNLVDKAEEDRKKIERIEDDSRRFASDVHAVAATAAPDLVTPGRDALDPKATTVELNARLARARTASQRREYLRERLAEQKKATEAARDAGAVQASQIDALCREAQCDSVGELPTVEARSRDRRDAERRLADLNTELEVRAAGETLDAFLAEAEQIDPDGVASRIAELGEEIDKLAHQRDELLKTIGSAENELTRIRDNPLADAANARQNAENLRATIRVDAEQYVRLRLASAVLRQGVERYRKKAEGPVLRRARELFAELTLRSFADLQVDYDDREKPVLYGIRTGSREPIGLKGMSDGTADQLYLALRLATLETFLDRIEPLPLIVDDILIQFDDDRARATLAILAELSRRTQILIFTHHAHVLDLAHDVVSSDLLVTHELPYLRSESRTLTLAERTGA
jgi:uncharacterized protein YhaN